MLTCKDRLVPYYSKFGFKMRVYPQVFMVRVVWYQMRLEFLDENNSKGKEISEEKKQKKAAKEELKQMIPTLRGQLNEVTSGFDELKWSS